MGREILTMMEILSDFSISCNTCGNVFRVSKFDLEFETSIYDHGDNCMGEEIDYLIEHSINCPYCNTEIAFKIFGSEYPIGAFDSEDSTIMGGIFIEKPHMGILYDIEEFETDAYFVEATGIQRLIIQISQNWEYIYNVTSRQFEEIVEQIFKDAGFETTLTKETHDGGKDIIATKYVLGKPVVFYIECKKYNRRRPIGVNLVRELVGVQTINRVNKTFLVTTTYFTDGAYVEAARQNTLIDLIDGNELKRLIAESAKKYFQDDFDTSC